MHTTMATGSAKLGYSSGFHLETLSGRRFSLTVKGGHDLMRSRCGFYSTLGYIVVSIRILWFLFGILWFSIIGHCEG